MADEAAALLRHGTATLCEAQARQGIVGDGIGPMWRPISLAGPAFTVEAAPGDNLAVHLAIAEVPAGAVLVVAVGGDTSHALIGDLMARAMLQRGVAGFVTDGAIRDSRTVRELGLPLFARARQIRGPAKAVPGRRQVTVALGGVAVAPGDWIVGDDDGLVVIRRDDLQATLAGARARDEKEAEVARRIDAGETTVRIMGLPGG